MYLRHNFRIMFRFGAVGYAFSIYLALHNWPIRTSLCYSLFEHLQELLVILFLPLLFTHSLCCFVWLRIVARCQAIVIGLLLKLQIYMLHFRKKAGQLLSILNCVASHGSYLGSIEISSECYSEYNIEIQGPRVPIRIDEVHTVFGDIGVTYGLQTEVACFDALHRSC